MLRAYTARSASALAFSSRVSRPAAIRCLATNERKPADAPETTDEEGEVLKKLSDKFTGGIAVQDMSGGCGSFYAIQIVDKQFEGLNKVKQHQLVNQILRDEIYRWHGVQLQTRAP